VLAWLFRHVPFLRLAPGLPALFDTLLLAGTVLLHPERRTSLHAIETAILSWPGVTTKIHRFGGTEFNLGRREIGHLHGNGLLDIPFTRPLRDEAVGAGRALPHHIFPRSGWISFYIRGEEDVPNAISLLWRSYDRWQRLDHP
jgi:hypothetical protein